MQQQAIPEEHPNQFAATSQLNLSENTELHLEATQKKKRIILRAIWFTALLALKQFFCKCMYITTKNISNSNSKLFVLKTMKYSNILTVYCVLL